MDEEVLNGSDAEVAAEGVDQNGDASPGRKGVALADGANGIASAERIKIKGKRNVRSLTKEASGGAHGVVHPVRKWKNSRRSRSGFGRGAPKKGRLWGPPAHHADCRWCLGLCSDAGGLSLAAQGHCLSPALCFRFAGPWVLEHFRAGPVWPAFQGSGRHAASDGIALPSRVQSLGK